MNGSVRVVLREIIGLASVASCPFLSAVERTQSNRTQHGLSRLTAISDAGSTPAASTKYLIINNLQRIRVRKVPAIPSMASGDT